MKKFFISPSSGVNLLMFKPLSNRIVECTLNTLVLGYVSRVDPMKGWDTLLLALSEIKFKYNFNNFKLIVIGGGTSINEAKKLAEKLHVEKHISWRGFKAQFELPYIYNSFDLFIFPTKLREEPRISGIGSHGLWNSSYWFSNRRNL